MDNDAFRDEILGLLSKGHEGGYWDYKSDYPDCAEDKLKDIICMANNLENRDAYLIYGANDDGTVCGIENTKSKSRMKSLDIVKFLRSKPFAGGYYPETEVRKVIVGEHELDVLIIFNRRHTPYYLQNDYGKNSKRSKNLTAGTVYTRTFDGNTQPNETASIEQTEYLWRKRFGYDMMPYQRLIYLLDQPENWSKPDWSSHRQCYNLESPEFQIIAETSENGYDDLSFFYDNEAMFYAPLKLNYLTTTLYETELWYMDGGCCIIPAPKRRVMENSQIFYYYFLKDSIHGKLVPFFNYGKFQCHNRSGLEMPILLFRSEKEQQEFEVWVNDNIDKKEIEEEQLFDNAIYEHILSKSRHDGIDRGQGVKNIAISFRLFKKWGKGLCTGECFLK